LNIRNFYLQKLLELGAKMDDKDNLGNNALCIASVMGHTDVVKILIHEQLEKGSSLASIINYQNFEGSTPLMLSSAAGHLDVVR
jgi:ankyrin repeat protein